MASYFLICFASLLVSALTLFSGFGLGTMLMPVFAIFFPIEIAIGATAIVHLVNNVAKAILVGKMAHWATVLKFGIPASIAAVVGAFLLSELGGVEAIARYEFFGHTHEIQPIKLAVGMLLILFAITEVLPSIKKITIPSKFIPLGGILSGFLGGLTGIQGALRSMFLIRANLSKKQFIGTTVLAAIIVDISRLAVYGATVFLKHLPVLKQEAGIGLVAAGTLSAILGSVAASKLLKKVTYKTIQYLVSNLLLMVGLGLSLGWI